MRRALLFVIAGVAFAQLRVDFSTTAVAGSDSTLYAISGANLFRTTDLGANWTAAYPTAAPGQAQQVLAIATNPLDPSTVYVGTDMDKGGVWKSTDSGVTWTRVNTGLPTTGSVETFFPIENQPSTLYLKIGSTLYKTSNAGASWTLQSTLPAAGSAFAINTRTPGLMYFARQALGDSSVATVFRSLNEGSTWDIAGTVNVKPTGDPGTPNSVGAIASSPANPDLVFLSTRGPLGSTPYTAIHKSSSRGASFAVSRAGGNAQRMIADSNGNIFWTSSEASAGGARLEKTSNAGATWDVKTIGSGITGQPQSSVDLQHAGTMFAGLASGAYRSTDAGETWTRLSGLVKATLPGAPFDFRGAPGNRLAQNLRVQFVENTAWTAPFTATVQGASWLTLSVASGTTPATIEVRASTEGLAKGDYSANIRISSAASATGDVLIPVTLSVTDAPVVPRSYRISTSAGGGTLPPIGAAPTQAKLSSGWGVALDPSGNLVILDITLNQIFRVKNGILELVAGSGIKGTSGDDGPATAAQLNFPTAVAFGNSGDLYVADSLNFRIRRIDSQGVISAVGTGTRFSLGGLLVDASGNLYSASGGEVRVRTPAGADTRFAVGPQTPGQIVRDSKGNFYVPDRNLHQVVRITPEGVSTVVAGTGTAGFSGDGAAATSSQLNNPSGVAVDADGNVFIADTSNYRVRMVDTNGIMFTVAGTGTSSSVSSEGSPATGAPLFYPYSLALDVSGNLYVGDSIKIRKLTLVRPSIKPNGVANAASYTPDASPGSLVAIFGDDLATGTDAAKAAPWPTTLAGATVTLNGRLMPLYYVSPGQVNAMVPYETPLGPATLVVSVGGVTSASYTVNISQASPGVIAFGDNRAVAVNEDGSINTAANPAKPGSTLVIYMIGIGPTDFPVGTGAAAPLDNLIRPAGPATVTLGSQTVTPQFLGLTPGSVALAQLNLKLDDNLANGDYAVKVTIAGKESNAPLISVRK